MPRKQLSRGLPKRVNGRRFVDPVAELLRSALFRHSLLNVAAAAAPLLVALPCLAVLPRSLSPEEFSLLLMAWALVGYAGILDLGLSRTVVVLVAKVRGDEIATSDILINAATLATCAGVLGCCLVYFGAPWIASNLIRVSPEEASDAVLGFRIIAFSVPLLLLFLVVQGFWDGLEKFGESNLQRVVSGSIPLVLATTLVLVAPAFSSAAAGILVGRALTAVLALSRGGVLVRLRRGQLNLTTFRALMGFGGWVTVSNAISPLMSYLDRYILAFAKSAGVVAYYAAPAELVLKLLILPVAITRSLYPKLAGVKSKAAKRGVVLHAYWLIGGACIPLAMAMVLLAPWGVPLWLGSDLGGPSTPVFQLLAVGFAFSALAQVPFTQLHASGRPDLTAWLHVAEAAVFLPVIYLLSARYGLIGCAAAWVLRNFVDLVALSVLARLIDKNDDATLDRHAHQEPSATV